MVSVREARTTNTLKNLYLAESLSLSRNLDKNTKIYDLMNVTVILPGTMYLFL